MQSITYMLLLPMVATHTQNSLVLLVMVSKSSVDFIFNLFQYKLQALTAVLFFAFATRIDFLAWRDKRLADDIFKWGWMIDCKCICFLVSRLCVIYSSTI
jgi:hypothetical protein